MEHRATGRAIVFTTLASACTFGAFGAFLGWYSVSGGRSWKGWTIPALALLAGQGLGVPGWTARRGLRLMLAALVAGAILAVALIIPLFWIVLPGLPIGWAFGRASYRPRAGAIGGFLGFNLLLLAGLLHIFGDTFDAPGVVPVALFGAFGGAVLAVFISMAGGSPAPDARRPHEDKARAGTSRWESRDTSRRPARF